MEFGAFRFGSRVLGAVAITTLVSGAAARAQSVDVAVYRMKQDSATLVLGALEVQRPLGGARPCPYRVQLRVTDPKQTALLNEQWREERGCPSSAARTIGTFETLRFAAAPGRYDITVSMHPDGKPEETHRKSIALETLPRDARASDLIVAREIGVVDSTNQSRWTIRHDGVGMLAERELRLAPETAKLAFYLEVYPRRNEPFSGKLIGNVIDADGKSIARMDLAAINGTGARTRLAGAVSVAGLAPGSYRLEAIAQLA